MNTKNLFIILVQIALSTSIVISNPSSHYSSPTPHSNLKSQTGSTKIFDIKDRKSAFDSKTPSTNSQQQDDEFSDYWAKVYDREVARHEKQIENQAKREWRSRPQAKILNFARVETSDDTHKKIIDQPRPKNLETADENLKVVKNEEEQRRNNDAVVVKMRSRHRHEGLKPDRAFHQHHVGEGKARVVDDLDPAAKESEDRKRLPRNAAWFVQAALRMCESGQDPRCKKISVRKGNVKISIKIAED